MRILNHDAVTAALRGREFDLLHTVQRAYLLHATGDTEVPFSTFLRPPGRPDDRFIALPSYLGGPQSVAGIKWISSFPSNLDRGTQRAASVVVVNDLETGYPIALLEGSQISASRTAASAAVASHFLHGDDRVDSIGLIGSGTINLRTMDFLSLVHPELTTVAVYDTRPDRAAAAAHQLSDRHPEIRFFAADLGTALRAQTISIATTDSSYWLDLPAGPDHQVVLHLSLRDLDQPSILGAFNVVDDVDHVCREQTSLHKVEQQLGHRAFIQATLGDLMRRNTDLKAGRERVIFSPFGLGALDMAVAAQVLSMSSDGVTVPGFDPGVHAIADNTTEVAR